MMSENISLLTNGETSKNNLVFAWKNLSYSIKTYPFMREKTILSHLNGYINFGTLTALMGSSGAGKSTLLKCINGRNNSGLSGDTEIYISRERTIHSVFIVQDVTEHLMMGLTVREALMYASKLKNTNLESDSMEDNRKIVNHTIIIEKIMKDLMILETADTIIKKCSDGELKRIAIALELTAIKMPNLLCIDEPTTGLDSNAAEVLVKCLLDISRKHNIAILASIHQPNNEILMTFDQICVLSKGGICIYFGSPQNIGQHLDSCAIECNDLQIPIEVMMKVASNEKDTQYVNLMAKKTLTVNNSMIESFETIGNLSYNGINMNDSEFFIIDLWHLILRGLWFNFRSEWKTMILRFIVILGGGLVLSQLYDKNIGEVTGCLNPSNHSCSDTIKSLYEEKIVIQNFVFLFTSICLYGFLESASTAMTFSKEYKIFINEHNNGWYSTSSYYWAKTIVEMPILLIIAIGYSITVYCGSGQINESSRLYQFIYIYIGLGLCSQGLGFLIGIITVKNNRLALVFLIASYTILVLFCDFLFSLKYSTKIVQIISNLSFPHHAFKACLIIIYGFGRCPSQEIPFILLRNKLNDKYLWYYLIMMIVHTLNVRILTLLLMYFTTKSSRRKKYSSMKTFPKIDFDNANANANDIDSSLIPKKLSLQIDSEECEEINTNNLAIAWTNLSFSAKETFSRKRKPILKQLNGHINYGSLTALMGPSGAGKTTLLKCINGIENKGLSDDTKIYGNGTKKIRSSFIKKSVDDHLLMGLTGSETLIYASKIKNSEKKMKSNEKTINNNDTKINHNDIVSKLMKDLMISNTENTEVSKCSGGEQKRLMIAIELIAHVKPDIICIDEPTSGLDSNAAEVVINCLRQIARSHGIAIFTSVHQPNADVLIMFHQIYVLSKGGMCIYSDSPKSIRQFLQHNHIECNDSQIPIEILLKIASEGIQSVNVKKLVIKTSELNKDVENLENTTVQLNTIKPKIEKFNFNDFYEVLARTVISNCRSQWISILLQYLTMVGLCVSYTFLYDKDIGKVYGCVRVKLDPNSTIKCASTFEESRENDLLFQFTQFSALIIIFHFLIQMIGSMMAFTDMQIFFNEHRNGWYSTGVYYWAKTITELPLSLIISISVGFVYYYGSGQIGENFRFIGIILFFIGCGLSVQGHAFLFSIIFSNNDRLCTTFALLYYFLLVFLCGYIAPVNELHELFKYLTHISYINYVFQSTLILIFGFNRCDTEEIPALFYKFGLNDDQLFVNSIGLIIHVIILRVLAFFALFIIANRK